MTQFAIEEHTTRCRFKERGTPFQKNFLLQYNFDFYLVAYCPCMETCDHLSWKYEVFTELSLLKKPSRKCTERLLSRGNILKDAIRDREVNFLLSRSMEEVCYIYQNATGKEFCFVHTLYFSDYLTGLINYSDNFRVSRNQIEGLRVFSKGEKDFLIDQIDKLNIYNGDPYNELTDWQKIKFTKQLSNQILKKAV